ncbi:hypothetical protein LCGC14_2114210 [marine sediment metagenome]|uniref:Uncharacterized protein n=1 Tax=marine sediment metagenome TaxID=412755 RepID=A0A0F9ETA6_9ZZZZ
MNWGWTIVTTGAVWMAAGLFMLFGDSEIASGLLIGNGVALVSFPRWSGG